MAAAPPPDVCQAQVLCSVEGRIEIPGGFPGLSAASITLSDGRCLTLALPGAPAATWVAVSQGPVRLVGKSFKTTPPLPEDGTAYIGGRYKVRDRWVAVATTCTSNQGLYVEHYEAFVRD